MKIYIASSWKNQHAVEMLTELLRGKGHKVFSFIENSFGENEGEKSKPFGEWVRSRLGSQAFDYDTTGAMTADLVIYVSPSGTDAWAEVGAAWAKDVTILGLHAKGEQSGLMRRMVDWYPNHKDLLREVDHHAGVLKKAGGKP